MTNPYQAPLEDNEAAPIPGKRYGPVGCGCAAIAILALLTIGFAALFLSVEAPIQPVPPAPVVAPVPQKAAPPPVQQLEQVDSAE